MRRVSDGAFIARILTTHKEAGDLFVHNVRVENHGLQVGMRFRLDVNPIGAAPSGRTIPPRTCCTRRCGRFSAITSGEGWLVAPERLRFDFSHPKPVSPDELERVEEHRQRYRAAKRAGNDAADGGR